MATTPKRTAIYARVSTTDKGQDTENQLPRLRDWCGSMGYEVVAEYDEQVSGAKGITGREQFARLFTDASQRKFDLLVFWSLDRFSREGLAATITHLERLSSYGVAFHSYTEPYLSTDNEFARDVLLSILASLAKLQRRKISENTKAGLERKRRQGVRLGRPPLSPAKRWEIKKLVGKQSLRSIARDLKIPYTTVQRIAKQQT